MAAMNECTESIAKLSVDIENQRQNHLSVHSMMQSQLEFINGDMMKEREVWSQRRSELQEKVLHCLGEQGQLLSQERQARETAEENLTEQIRVERTIRERQQSEDQEAVR